MRPWLAIGAVIFALAVALVVSAVKNGLEKTGTTDDAAHVVRVVTDNADRGLANLFK